jgi:uncharacterized protein
LFRVVNSTRQKILANQAKRETSFFGRALGLMFTKFLAPDCGLILAPCSSIHMFWMAYAIDAVFLDRNSRVVGLVQEIKPWRTSKIFLHATACVELPPGTIAKSDTRIGDTLIIQEIPRDHSEGAALRDLISNERFQIKTSICTVGSGVDNAIQYDLEKSLSPNHFVIKEENKRYTIEDNASRHGTFVNGQRVGGATEIKNGDIIKAGVALFYFELGTVLEPPG